MWNENPGCFERHLQRKYLFPLLFSMDSFVISSAELEEAKRRDSEDVSKLNVDVSEFLHYLNHKFTLDETKGLLDRLEALEERAAGIGGDAVFIGKSLREGRKTLLSKLKTALINKEEKVDKDFYSAFFTLGNVAIHPFFAQCNRKDTPINEDEQVPSLLTEDPATITEVIDIFKATNKQWVEYFKNEAMRLTEVAIKKGKTIPNIYKKLRAFGVPHRQIFFGVTLKQIAIYLSMIMKR